MTRKSKKPLDISLLLQSSKGTLAQIKTKTNSLTILTDIVRQICPDLPEDAWHISNFKQNTLIIEVKSPVWGQRLQFERNNICRVLAENTDNQFSKIEIKVNPYRSQQVPQVNNTDSQNNSVDISTKTFLSQENAQNLLDIAENAPKGLKEKLQKLVKLANMR